MLPTLKADLPIDRELGLCSGFTLGVVTGVARLAAQMAFASVRQTWREVYGWAPAPCGCGNKGREPRGIGAAAQIYSPSAARGGSSGTSGRWYSRGRPQARMERWKYGTRIYTVRVGRTPGCDRAPTPGQSGRLQGGIGRERWLAEGGCAQATAGNAGGGGGAPSEAAEPPSSAAVRGGASELGRASEARFFG